MEYQTYASGLSPTPIHSRQRTADDFVNAVCGSPAGLTVAPTSFDQSQIPDDDARVYSALSKTPEQIEADRVIREELL